MPHRGRRGLSSELKVVPVYGSLLAIFLTMMQHLCRNCQDAVTSGHPILITLSKLVWYQLPGSITSI